MYSVVVKSVFNAAHNLRGYRGKCERLHGHNWNVEARFSSPALNGQGMVIDFKDARSALNKVIMRLDHRYLNSIPYFRKHNPSSENLARYIYETLSRSFRRSRCRLREVAVWETENSCALYSEDGTPT